MEIHPPDTDATHITVISPIRGSQISGIPAKCHLDWLAKTVAHRAEIFAAWCFM